jgi:hypothetical protein
LQRLSLFIGFEVVAKATTTERMMGFFNLRQKSIAVNSVFLFQRPTKG